MKIEQVSAQDLLEFVDSNQTAERLSTYLARVRNGMDVDIRTPFWGGRAREDVVTEWSHILERADLTTEIAELEMSQKTKIGPLSVQLPYEERKETIQPYYDLVRTKPDLDAFSRAIIVVSRRLNQARNLRPLSYENAAKLMQPSTNSGLPFFKKRRNVIDLDLKIAKSGAWRDARYAAILGWRGQSGGPSVHDVKQRVVWMMPQSLNIAEMRYFKILFDVMTTFTDIVSAWRSLDDVDKSLTSFIMSNVGTKLYSIDFSGYDQTVQHLLRTGCLEVMTNSFQLGYKTELEDLFYKAGNIALLAPDELWTGVHGEPSGSTLTNMRDTIVNWIANEYVAIRLKTNLKLFSQFQGDDGVVAFDGSPNISEITEIYKELGLRANDDKQYVSETSVHYLQRVHDFNFRKGGVTVGVYPTYRALNSLLGMERFHNDWDSKMVILRAVMILENTKNHPLFEEFIDFVGEGDKLGLGLKSPGGLAAVLDSSLDTAKGIPGFVSTYNSPKLSGIYNFRTVEYLLSKRKG